MELYWEGILEEISGIIPQGFPEKKFKEKRNLCNEFQNNFVANSHYEFLKIYHRIISKKLNRKILSILRNKFSKKS